MSNRLTVVTSVAYTDKKTRETRYRKRVIGVAFPIERIEGGYEIILDALPVSGKLSMYPPKADEDELEAG